MKKCINGMLNLSESQRIAIKASIEAANEIMEVYSREFAVDYKEDKSPLTEADERANSVINKHLSSTNIPIISEENKQIPYKDRKNWDRCWIVDPVDGTKEFVKRNGEFTVNIALVENGLPVFGVILVPVTKCLYIGDVKNKRSYKAELAHLSVEDDNWDNNITSIEPKKSAEETRIVGSRSHLNEKTSSYIKKIEAKGTIVSIVSKGSSLKFCLVAEGLADIYPRFAPTMEWDTAAGQAICNAVGVEVISLNTNKPLRYNKENLLNPEFIVSRNGEKVS